MSLFSQCTKNELEVLIKALEEVDNSHFNDKGYETKIMCLATLNHELKERYTQWEKK